jgi:hypothetical protein
LLAGAGRTRRSGCGATAGQHRARHRAQVPGRRATSPIWAVGARKSARTRRPATSSPGGPFPARTGPGGPAAAVGAWLMSRRITVNADATQSQEFDHGLAPFAVGSARSCG